jgi:Transcriptional regulator, AbiEi antitoxin
LSDSSGTLDAVNPDVPRSLSEIAASQCGVVTVKQAEDAGLSRELLKSRVRQGRWQRLHRGVYASFSGEPGRQAIFWAAVLYAGQGAMLSHRSAAEADGLSDEPSEVVHVTVPWDRRVEKSPGIVIHRSSRARRAMHPAKRPPRTRIEETVLDLAHAAVTLDDAVGWVTRGLGRRLTTEAKLRATLGQRARMRHRRHLAELLSPDMRGVLSTLEHRYVLHVERPHGLPPTERQAEFQLDGRRRYRDLALKAYRLIIELDGKLAHPAEERWRDIRRDNAAVADGTSTLRFGWMDVTITPCAVAAQLAEVLSRRGYTESRACSPSCPVGHVIALPKGA